MGKLVTLIILILLIIVAWSCGCLENSTDDSDNSTDDSDNSTDDSDNSTDDSDNSTENDSERINNIESFYIETIEENADSTGICVIVLANTSSGASVEGNGSIKIFFDDLEVFGDLIKFENGEVNKEIGFEAFVFANGDYTVEVSYGDKKDSDVHTINWVTEYIYIDSTLSEAKLSDEGEVVKGKLTLSINALNSNTTFLFNLPKNYKADLNADVISQGIIDEFENNHHSLSDNADENKILKINGDEWMILSKLKRYLLKDEGSQLAAHDIYSKGLAEKPKNVEIELSIYYEGNKVHTETITLNDASISIDTYDYHSTGAGEYRFDVEATNNMIKLDSALYGYVSASLTETLNQIPVAALTEGTGFSYDGKGTYASKHYEKTIYLTSSEAKDGYEITFDASNSFNDGPLTYQWDWDYFNDAEEEPEQFDEEDTGSMVSHTFYPDSIPLMTTHYYIGLRVVGDAQVEFIDKDGSVYTQLESNIVIIHLEFNIESL